MAETWTSSSVDAHLDWTPGSGHKELANAGYNIGNITTVLS